jgi:hypothetical protein
MAVFAPEWLTVWFAIAAVGAFILGFRRAGMALMGWPIIDWIVLPAIDPIIDQLPGWAVAALLVVVALLMLQGALSLLFGPEAVGHVIGTYLVRLIDVLLLGPFRGLRWLFWTLFRGRGL